MFERKKETNEESSNKQRLFPGLRQKCFRRGTKRREKWAQSLEEIVFLAAAAVRRYSFGTQMARAITALDGEQLLSRRDLGDELLDVGQKSWGVVRGYCANFSYTHI